MEQELINEFGTDTDVQLIAGSNGVFEITLDGELIFSKRQLGRFPDDGEIIRLVLSK